MSKYGPFQPVLGIKHEYVVKITYPSLMSMDFKKQFPIIGRVWRRNNLYHRIKAPAIEDITARHILTKVYYEDGKCVVN